MTVSASRLRELAVFAEWEQMIADGSLTTAGLQAIRLRLLFSNEFESSALKDHMVLLVGDALGERLGIPPELLVGSPLIVPDDVSELFDPGESARDW